jgi:hypothetical protein
MKRRKCQDCEWRDAYLNPLVTADGARRYLCEMCWLRRRQEDARA